MLKLRKNEYEQETALAENIQEKLEDLARVTFAGPGVNCAWSRLYDQDCLPNTFYRWTAYYGNIRGLQFNAITI